MVPAALGRGPAGGNYFPNTVDFSPSRSRWRRSPEGTSRYAAAGTVEQISWVTAHVGSVLRLPVSG